MSRFYQGGNVTVHAGDCLEVMASLPDSSVDAVVTDPPYALGFMGRAWDSFGSDRNDGVRGGSGDKGILPGYGRGGSSEDRFAYRQREAHEFQAWCQLWAIECLRLLKPGGHLLAFGGTRTHHRLACAVEDAGFEIRDSIAWLYGSGFPKSLNLPGGLGTALKPAHEPIVVARKPLRGTVAANVVEHGTGALNIDDCRVGSTGATRKVADEQRGASVTAFGDGLNGGGGERNLPFGRWPANVVIDDTTAAEIDKQSGITRSTANPRHNGDFKSVAKGYETAHTTHGHDDLGGASRFFPTFRYEPKAPTTERPSVNGVAHPTVKPLDLMRWLVRLVTPPNGIVLDPFAGSGTTAEACIHEHKRAIVIEREPDYLPLILARLSKPMAIGFNFGESA